MIELLLGDPDRILSVGLSANVALSNQSAAHLSFG
jgi:hypothetical protein